ncbi:MAG: cytochrome c [Pseudomonadales bacterium]
MIESLHRAPVLRALKHLGLGLMLVALPAAASEGEVEYREHVMEAIGGHMQAAADIAQQKVAHSDHLSLHVNGLVALSGIIDTLFPESSQGGDALDAIWENPDDFAAKIADFQQAAGGLKMAVDGGGDVGSAFQKVGQACKACHDDYRAE